jgi:putative CocE/NonD family hydrolase
MPKQARCRRSSNLPYRKRDGTICRDELTHPYVAGHGYACIRVDMRGNGDSEGLMEDEYSEQELQDACDVIAWAAAQPWCNGNVGMMGISWGGFNALQVAAKQPPALKAIITLCSTVDRYADDIHYKGGCLLGENAGWAATMLSYSSRPPDPAIVGERWRECGWSGFTTSRSRPLWLGHQHRDAYWKRGSVCEDFSAIKAAVLSIGGWHDGYRNTVANLVEHRSAGEGHRRPVDTQISALRRAGAAHRLPAGGAALVGPLAERHRHGRRETIPPTAPG